MAAIAGTAAAGLVGAYFLRQFFKGGVCTSDARMDGKTVVITGCNTGIGKETALDLSRRGARVVMACRNLDLANKAADDVRGATKGQVVVYKLDLASLESVRASAKEIVEKEPRVDVLLNNAGVMLCPLMRTKEGFEMQMGTNHYGHFLFTNLLLDKLKACAPSRVVNVSSRAHERGAVDLDDTNWEKRPYNSFKAYEQSKLANVLFTKELSRRLEGTGVNAYALHPGVVRTELGRHVEDYIGVFKYLAWALIVPFTKNPTDGAQTSIYCAVDEALAEQSGLYYSDCAVKEPQPQAKDMKMAKELWELSEKLVGMK